jgi:hypothetical protein
MGKRELLIILGFVVVGVVAYQLTAPAATSSEGFSFSKIWNAMKREVHGNPSRAEYTHTGSFEAPPTLTEVRFSDVSRLRVIGEARTDVGYELKVESSGPDDAQAVEYAKRTVLKKDDMGTALTFRVEYPPEARQTSELTVKVPLRMTVRIQGGSRVEATNLASVRLEGVSSTAKISSIAGALTGTHRGGDLEVVGVGAVRLSLSGSQAKFEEVRQALTLDMRNSECEINQPKGSVEIEEINSRVTITEPAGTVRAGGERGRILVTAPEAETRVDVRRAEVEVLLKAAVPMTLVTTDEELRLVLDGPPSIEIDAVASNGSIATPGLDLKPDTAERETRLTHAFGKDATVRASLRNLRGEIVIRMVK